MDEYEKLEAELKKIYEEYIIKFRCQVSSGLKNYVKHIARIPPVPKNYKV